MRFEIYVHLAMAIIDGGAERNVVIHYHSLGNPILLHSIDPQWIRWEKIRQPACAVSASNIIDRRSN